MIAELRTRIMLVFGQDGSLLRRMSKNFSIGFGGSTFLLLMGLARTALLTKTLSTADYGRVLVVINLFGLLSAFFSVRVNDFLYRFFPQFLEEDDSGALRGLLLLSLGLSGVVGLLISGGVFMSARWIAEQLYDDTAYLPLLQLYAVAAFFSAFDGFHTAILRLQDRFALVVIPQAVGTLISLMLLFGYLLGAQSYRLDIVVAFIATGVVIATTPSLLLAIHSVWSYLFVRSTESALYALSKYRGRLLSMLFQINLLGYLKLGTETGGIFVLGIVAGPGQVALYGIGQQLVRPLRVFQDTILAAITPEIVSLSAKQEMSKLYRLMTEYTKYAVAAGGVALLVAVSLAKPVLVIFTTPDYLEALPIFYILILSTFITFAALAFFPLTVAMDELKRRNTVFAISFLYLAVAIMVGLNAVRLAVVQLVFELTVRIFNDLPLLKKLRSLIRERVE